MSQQCPYCHQTDVSEDAPYCPHCGAHLHTKRSLQERRKLMTGWIAGLGCLFAMGGSCLLAGAGIITVLSGLPFWTVVKWIFIILVVKWVITSLINWFSKSKKPL